MTFALVRYLATFTVCIATSLAAQGQVPPYAGDQFGGSVALDGNRMLVGAPGDDEFGLDRGSAYVLERTSSGIWTRTAKLVVPDEEGVGEAVALDGETALVLSGGDSGRPIEAYFYNVQPDGTWALDLRFLTEQRSIKALALTLQGSLAAISDVNFPGTVDTFERLPSGGWIRSTSLESPSLGEFGGSFGSALALSGTTLAVGARDAALRGVSSDGAVYIYERQDDGSWTQQSVVLPDDVQTNSFGEAVALEGNRLVVGAGRDPGPRGDRFFKGAIYVFERQADGTWRQEAKLFADESAFLLSSFGGVVALDGDVLAAGSLARTSVDGVTNPRAVEVFERLGGVWQRTAQFTGDAQGGFGEGLALSQDRLIVGNRLDDTQGEDAGAVNVYERTSNGWTPAATVLAQDDLPPPIPAPWLNQDVGHPELTGRAYIEAERFVLQGGGDIWGNDDAFHYVYQPLKGDGQITATYDDTSLGFPAKVGLILRRSLDTNAPNVFYADPGGFQTRLTPGGETTTQSVRVARRLRLVRVGNTVTAQRLLFDRWEEVATVVLDLDETVYVGMAVTATNIDAERPPRLNTARFLDPVVESFGPGGLPAPWTTADLGPVLTEGAASFDARAETFALSGSGDVWGDADAFRYLWQPVAGNLTLTARLDELTGPNPWSKVGLMVRGSAERGAPHAFLLATPERGLHVQYRLEADALMESYSVESPAVFEPVWLRLTRSGDYLQALTSPDGKTWTEIAAGSLSLGDTVLLGLAVTATDLDGTGMLAEAAFSEVQVEDEVLGTRGERSGSFTGTASPDVIAVQAYPNPFTATTTLGLDLPRSGTYEVAIYDLLGRVVQRWTLVEPVGASARIEADFSSHAAGMYVVRAQHQESGVVASERVTLLR